MTIVSLLHPSPPEGFGLQFERKRDRPFGRSLLRGPIRAIVKYNVSVQHVEQYGLRAFKIASRWARGVTHKRYFTVPRPIREAPAE